MTQSNAYWENIMKDLQATNAGLEKELAEAKNVLSAIGFQGIGNVAADIKSLDTMMLKTNQELSKAKARIEEAGSLKITAHKGWR